MNKLKNCSCGTEPETITYINYTTLMSEHSVRCPNCKKETKIHPNCWEAMLEWGFDVEEGEG